MFIYSFPLLFSHIQWGTPLHLIIVIFFIAIVLFIASPKSSVDDIEWESVFSLTFYQYLFQGWNGYLKLWCIFWPFFIVLNISLYMTDTIAKQGLFTVSSWDEVHFMLVMPIIFWIIAVWRNSVNTVSRYWAMLARLMTLSVLFEFGLKLVIRQDYPRIFFACQDIMLDYASCF